jgi:hypothetical protein
MRNGKEGGSDLPMILFWLLFYTALIYATCSS